jgi:hypothetical protein
MTGTLLGKTNNITRRWTCKANTVTKVSPDLTNKLAEGGTRCLVMHCKSAFRLP